MIGGLIGLAWWWFRLRRRPHCTPEDASEARRRSRLRRVRVAGLAVLLLLIGVGTVWRADVAVSGVAECRHPRVERAALTRKLDASLVAEKFVTWPETGLGMTYGQATGSSLCRYTPADYYVDFHSGRIAGARSMNVLESGGYARTGYGQVIGRPQVGVLVVVVALVGLVVYRRLSRH